MTKSIVDFREEDYGLFIDLASHSGRIGVDRTTGDILLDEGEGDDCYNGAAVEARSFRRFELKPIKNGTCEVILYFGEKGAHRLGMTHDTEAARTWVHNATTVIKQHVPIHAAPELQSQVSIFSDAVRIMHPPANYGEFQLRPELDRLSDWVTSDKKVCVVRGAWGTGKSTLATHFMLSACPGSIAGYRDARTPFESAFYFSFYDDPHPASFLRSLGHWLDPDTQSSLTSLPHILRMLLSAGPKLIVLDGIEAIQCRDQHSSVKKLVNAIAESRKAVVRLLMTTRDDKLFRDETSMTFIVLERLPQDNAIALLRSRGVDGDEPILRQFARALDYHPISLDMAGHCIREFGWQKSWSAFLEPTSEGSRKNFTLTTLNFDTVVGDFVDRLTEAAPPAAELLGRLHKLATRATDVVPQSSIFCLEHQDIVGWCLDVLRRTNVVTSFVERDGYVGAASGGSARYQFEPEVRLRTRAYQKMMMQPARVLNTEAKDGTDDSLRERVSAWLPVYLSTKKRKSV